MKKLKQLIKDDIWRLSNLYKIVDKKSTVVKFKPNAAQRLINESKAKRKIILKPRQTGISTNEILKDLDAVMWHRNYTSCIIAHESDAIKKLFRIARRAYSFLPEQLRPDLDRGGGSRYEMMFPSIGSLIYSDLESRGDTINRLHVSEAARVAEERYVATMQAVPPGGEIVLESTAWGINNFFYDIWMDKDAEFEKFFFPWYFAPEYREPGEPLIATAEEEKFCLTAKEKYGYEIDQDQLRFRRRKKQELKSYFIQEFPEDDISCFLFSGTPCTDQIVLKKLLENISPVLYQKDAIDIFGRPSPKHHYVIGADTSQGIGRDFCVAIAYCVETKAAILRGHFSPFHFAKKLAELCEIFSTRDKMPLLAVERNNHGHAVIQELAHHLHYSNLYEADDGRLGWNTNSVTRPIMLNEFITAIEEQTVKLNSPVTFMELMTLVNNHGKIEAALGKHDDCVVAGAIGLQLLIGETRTTILYEDIDKAIMT